MSEQFKHSINTMAPSVGGEYSSLTDPQQFAIYGMDYDNKKDYLRRTEATAEFLYKNYIISFSTNGLNHFACRTEVAVFEIPSKDIIEVFHTVQEAIAFVDSLQ